MYRCLLNVFSSLPCSAALLCTAALLCAAALVGCDSAATTPGPPGPAAADSRPADGQPAAVTGTVSILVQVPEGETLREEVTITGRQSVAAVMAASSLEMELRGSGEMALVQSLAGVPMKGGEGWIYKVDGQWAPRGIGQLEVEPGAEIRWQYGRFDEPF